MNIECIEKLDENFFSSIYLSSSSVDKIIYLYDNKSFIYLANGEKFNYNGEIDL